MQQEHPDEDRVGCSSLPTINSIHIVREIRDGQIGTRIDEGMEGYSWIADPTVQDPGTTNMFALILSL